MSEPTKPNHKKSLRKCKKKDGLSPEDLLGCSKEELINKISQLQAHNLQLKNLLQKKNELEAKNDRREMGAKKKFDFSRVSKRHILLKFYYLGWDYQGFVVQEDTANTVEHDLFKALEQCCLVESRATSNYHRCGRTDKGVSAFCQVASLDVRSKLLDPSPCNVAEELPYCSMLNRLLPPAIRCYAWAHCPPGSSARFDCTSRTYKYLFPAADLNLEAMREASLHLVGCHDFRNLCKMDVGNGVVDFVREIKAVSIEPQQDSTKGSGYEMCVVTVEGSGFLWHQVRCLMAVLLLVGEGKEQPGVVAALLAVERHPAKPQYPPASHLPLCLFDARYASLEPLTWVTVPRDLEETIALLQRQWTDHAVKAAMLREMVGQLEALRPGGSPLCTQAACLQQGVRPKQYIPLLSRQTCESLDSRIDHYVKRRKLIPDSSSEDV